MSTNLQETIAPILENVPDLHAHGIEKRYAIAAWAKLFVTADLVSEETFSFANTLGQIRKNDPKFKRAMRLLAPVFLHSEAVPIAIAALTSIASNGKASPSARVSAANSILEHVKSHDLRGAGDGKTPEEMTLDEIQASIAELETEAANRAVDITPEKELDAPPLARDNAQLSDLL